MWPFAKKPVATFVMPPRCNKKEFTIKVTISNVRAPESEELCTTALTFFNGKYDGFLCNAHAIALEGRRQILVDVLVRKRQLEIGSSFFDDVERQFASEMKAFNDLLV